MARGVFWLFLEKGAGQISSFVVFAVIARLIGPEEYGLVGLCGIFMALSGNIIHGLVDAIISMHIKDNQRLSTLFWIVLFFGAFLSLFSFSIAGLFGQLMDQERLVPLLQSFSLLPVLMALGAVPTALITETMDFKIFTLRTLLSTLAGGIVGVVMALKGYGAYALVAQQGVMFFVRILVLWPSCHWWPRFVFKTEGMLEVIKLGFSQTGSSLVSFAEQQLPRFFLGLFVGANAVGLWVFIMRLRYALEEALVYPLITVLYPAFSEIREKPEEKKALLRQLFFVFGALLFPASWGAAVTAPLFVPLFFGDAWTPAIRSLQMVFYVSPIICLGFMQRDLFRAHKQTGDYLRLQTLLVAFSSALLFYLVRFGFSYFMIGWTLVNVLYFIAFTVRAEKNIHLPLWRSYRYLASSLISGMGMVAAIYGALALSTEEAGVVGRLVLGVGVGLVAYAGLFCAQEHKRLKALYLGFRRGQLRAVLSGKTV